MVVLLYLYHGISTPTKGTNKNELVEQVNKAVDIEVPFIDEDRLKQKDIPTTTTKSYVSHAITSTC